MPPRNAMLQERVQVSPDALISIFDKCGKRAVDISHKTGATLSSVQGKNELLVRAASRSSIQAAVDLIKKCERPKPRAKSCQQESFHQQESSAESAGPKSISARSLDNDSDDRGSRQAMSRPPRAIETVSIVQPEDWALAICMASQQRLGAGSLLGLLEPDLLRSICEGLVIQIPRDGVAFKDAAELVAAGKALHIHITAQPELKRLAWKDQLTVTNSLHITCEGGQVELHGTWELKEGSFGSMRGVALCSDRVMSVTSAAWRFKECAFRCASTKSWPNAVRLAGSARAVFEGCRFAPMRGGGYLGDAGSGVVAYDESWCRLDACEASGMWYSGFSCCDAARMELLGCRVEDCGYGVVMSGSAAATIEESVLRRCRDGALCASDSRSWSGRGGKRREAEESAKRRDRGPERVLLRVKDVLVEGGRAWAGAGQWSSEGSILVGGGLEVRDGEYRSVLPASRDLAGRLKRVAAQ